MIRDQQRNLLDLYTAPQVAQQLGIKRRRVLALARSRGLGHKLGSQWIFTEAEVEAMRERKPGRPPRERHAPVV